MCLKGYIGIRSCSIPPVESGVYINRLAGISIKSMEAIADDEQINFVGVWNDIEDRAIKRLTNKVGSVFKSKYKTKKVLSNIEVKKEVSDDVVTDGSQRGLRLYNTEVTSELAAIYIQNVWIYSVGNATDVSIKIANTNTNQELFSKKYNLVDSWNRLTINEYFNAIDVVIFYDDSEIQSRDLFLENSVNCSCDKSCNDDCQLSVLGYQKKTIATFGNNTFGMSITASLRCNVESIICANLDVFENALLYSLGMEFAFERMYSDRINRFTKLDIKSAEKLFADYQVEFENLTDEAVESIYINDDDVCIACQNTISQNWLIT